MHATRDIDVAMPYVRPGLCGIVSISDAPEFQFFFKNLAGTDGTG